ncbi:MAG TPA: DUF938 domain-containing protein [Minicystis sp.]|nr:DUF938 domain-containing protein [Minicystis sp.]
MTAKLHAAATERNRAPILEVLARVLPTKGFVLEIASGTGEHAVHFARALPGVRWQPTDADAAALGSIAAHRAEAELPNLLAPVRLDVRDAAWPVDAADAVVCINMIHIAPFAACEALFRGAAARLAPQSPLVLYGPFRFDGVFTAPSNAAFDADLRARDPAWGVRDLADVQRVARAAGFVRDELVGLPANNHAVVFRRV